MTGAVEATLGIGGRREPHCNGVRRRANFLSAGTLRLQLLPPIIEPTPLKKLAMLLLGSATSLNGGFSNDRQASVREVGQDERAGGAKLYGYLSSTDGRFVGFLHIIVEARRSNIVENDLFWVGNGRHIRCKLGQA